MDVSNVGVDCGQLVPPCIVYTFNRFFCSVFPELTKSISIAKGKSKFANQMTRYKLSQS